MAQLAANDSRAPFQVNQPTGCKKNRHHPHFVYETSILFLISRQTGKRLLLFEFGILESIPNAANGFNLAAMFAHFSTKCSNVNVDGPFHNKRVLT